jgi:hypothetical protein
MIDEQRYAMFTFSDDQELAFVNPDHIVMVHSKNHEEGSYVLLSTGKILSVDEERNEIVNAITGDDLP